MNGTIVIGTELIIKKGTNQVCKLNKAFIKNSRIYNNKCFINYEIVLICEIEGEKMFFLTISDFFEKGKITLMRSKLFLNTHLRVNSNKNSTLKKITADKSLLTFFYTNRTSICV